MPLLFFFNKYQKKNFKYLDHNLFEDSYSICFPSNTLNSKMTRLLNVKYSKYFSFRSPVTFSFYVCT